MNEAVKKQLLALEYGDACAFENLALVPLSTSVTGGPQYLTLQEAMSMGVLVVKEIGEGGSVPELSVENRSDSPVLLLDGEELVGAKQNRVLTTTILLKEKQKTIVPVSCTEQGRWSYVSEQFDDSGVVMAAGIRGAQRASVNYSLRQSGRFASDQSEVWHRIAALSRDADVHAPTGVMRDVFQHKSAAIEDYTQALPCLPGQQGMVVLVNSRVVGCDFVSLPSAYAILHTKLLKSYAMEALVAKRARHHDGHDYPAKARSFLDSSHSAAEQQHPSIGYGVDYRYENGGIVGSALVHEGFVIHAAFFATARPSRSDPMAGAAQRRRFRQV